MIELRKTTIDDLETLYVFQTDHESNWMAAFTSENPNDKKAYMEKWTGIVKNPMISMQTIRLEDQILGSVIHFDVMEETNISYWIDRSYWGKGIATSALKMFVNYSVKRPLFARVAHDNYGSQKVLEKCEFQRIGRENGFANARKIEIEEFVYRLDN